MSPFRLPKALVAASVFALLIFGFLSSSSLRRAEPDHGDVEYGNVKVEMTIQSALERLEPTTLRPAPSTALAHSSNPLPTPIATTTPIEPLQSPTASADALSPSDVVLLLKTGAATSWRRLPLHLLTTFANDRIPNFAIYSDASERLSSSVETIDIIANVSHIIQEVDPEAYHIYATQQEALRPHIYREQAGLPGDEIPAVSEDGNPVGWTLDRYKFLPMLAHARENWPDAKWVVYIEDDTYIFWQNIIRWLSRRSHQEVVYFGATSGPTIARFAQGGSGIAFSQALMTKLFASDNSAGLEVWGKHTAQSCCGDVVLGDVLRDHGIRVNLGEFGSLAFRPEPPWKTTFDVAVWCEPVMTFHHLHEKDLALLADLEDEIHRENHRRVLFRDVYMKFIDPYLQIDQLSGWDNYADLYLLKPDVELPVKLQDSGIDISSASSTVEGCRDACLSFAKCFSWRFQDGKDGSCTLDTGVKLGRATPPALGNTSAVVSGWILPRLNETLISHECWGFRYWD